jgi:hypothetical protein
MNLGYWISLRLINFARVEKDRLPDSQSADARDRSVDARIIVVRLNRCLQHFRSQTPLDAVPAQRGGFERLAAHGFHRIAVNCFNLSNLDRHFVQGTHEITLRQVGVLTGSPRTFSPNLVISSGSGVPVLTQSHEVEKPAVDFPSSMVQVRVRSWTGIWVRGIFTPSTKFARHVYFRSYDNARLNFPIAANYRRINAFPFWDVPRGTLATGHVGTAASAVRRSEAPRQRVHPHSAILATCRSKPVFGKSDASSKALKPSPVISV